MMSSVHICKWTLSLDDDGDADDNNQGQQYSAACGFSCCTTKIHRLLRNLLLEKHGIAHFCYIYILVKVFRAPF